MKRSELLDALQKIPWTPCEESKGHPRYRAVEAYHCTYCAYTLCGKCYNTIPTSLLSLPATGGNCGVDDGLASRPQVTGKFLDGAPPQATSLEGVTPDDSGGGLTRPRCFLCPLGYLVRDTVPPYEWTCEGPRPGKRLAHPHMSLFDVDVVQRYYMMRQAHEERARSQAPLVVRFVGADSPSTGFSNCAGPLESSAGSVMQRRPFCEEGGSFVCSIQNPRLEISLVWCAVNRQLYESHPSFSGDETITPLHTVRCPPTLPGLPPHQMRVHIPYGVYGIERTHAVALYLTDDIYQGAVVKSDESQCPAKAAEGLREEQSQLQEGCSFGTGKVLQRSTARPLLVVDVLHRIATSDPVRDCLRAEWVPVCEQSALSNRDAKKGKQNSDSCDERAKAMQGKDAASYEDGKVTVSSDPVHNNNNNDKPPLTWPDRLRCEELLLVVDYLLQGRSVAVYGIASKFFFMHHIAQCAEFRDWGVTFVDCHRSSANRVARQLHDFGVQLKDHWQREERATLRNLMLHGEKTGAFVRLRRSEAVPRDEKSKSPTQHYITLSSSSDSDSARSRSYRTPVKGSPSSDLKQSTEAKQENEDQKASVVNVTDGKSSEPQTYTPRCKGKDVVPSPAPGAAKREHSPTLVQHGNGLGPQESGRKLKKRREEKGCTHAVPPVTADINKIARIWSNQYCLHEQSDWNYNIPLDISPNTQHQLESNGQYTSSMCSPGEERQPLQPRYVVTSPEVMRRLRVECRAPLRSCVQWSVMPSPMTQRYISESTPHAVHTHIQSSVIPPKQLLVVHGIDELEISLLMELQNIARNHPYRVALLCSFDNPNWAVSSGAALLEPFRLAYVQLHSLLLPRVYEMASVKSLTLLTDFEASAAGGKKFGYHTSKGGPTGALLPLQDTIRRILFSLPAAFSEVLRCMIGQQEASGENVYVPMSIHQQHFDDCGLIITMGRLKAIEKELTSNRLAIFDAAENKLMIPQHRKLLRILDEVSEERENARAGGGRPVEA